MANTHTDNFHHRWIYCCKGKAKNAKKKKLTQFYIYMNLPLRVAVKCCLLPWKNWRNAWVVAAACLHYLHCTFVFQRHFTRFLPTSANTSMLLSLNCINILTNIKFFLWIWNARRRSFVHSLLSPLSLCLSFTL